MRPPSLGGTRLGLMVVAGGSLGLAVATLSGSGRRLSIDVWLGVVILWLAWFALRDLVGAVPLMPSQVRVWWPWPWPRRRRSAPLRPRSLMMWEGMVLNGCHNERAMHLRLRPRLGRLVDHFARTRHGVEVAHSPRARADLLGNLDYLVDPDAEPRRADLDDLDHLLDLLLGPDPAPGEPV